MTVFKQSRYIWSREGYSPRDVINKFERVLPFLGVTTRGFLGRDDGYNTVSADELMWVRSVYRRQRVIVQDSDNTCLSIPLDFSQPILAVKQGTATGKNITNACLIDKAQSTTLRRLLQDTSYTQFRFLDKEQDFVFNGAKDKVLHKFGTLTILRKCSEDVLLVHTIVQSTLVESASVIPAYMPTKFHIAVGLREGDLESQFFQAMVNLKAIVDDIPADTDCPADLMPADDILLHDQLPVADEMMCCSYGALDRRLMRRSVVMTVSNKLAPPRPSPDVSQPPPRTHNTWQYKDRTSPATGADARILRFLSALKSAYQYIGESANKNTGRKTSADHNLNTERPITEPVDVNTRPTLKLQLQMGNI